MRFPSWAGIMAVEAIGPGVGNSERSAKMLLLKEGRGTKEYGRVMAVYTEYNTVNCPGRSLR